MNFSFPFNITARWQEPGKKRSRCGLARGSSRERRWEGQGGEQPEKVTEREGKKALAPRGESAEVSAARDSGGPFPLR